MPLRAVNDAITVSAALQQLGAVMVVNTALQAASGQILINDSQPLHESTGPWPALLVQEDQTISLRQAVRTWKKSCLAICTYFDMYSQQDISFDSLWANIDLDLRRMAANLEDNPTISSGGVVYIERVVRMTFSPYGDHEVDDTTYGVPVVQRQLVVELELPAYVSAL